MKLIQSLVYAFCKPTIIVSTLVLLAAPSCKEKCDEHYLGTLVTMNPYWGTEILVFKNSNNLEIEFIGQGRSVRMNTVGPIESGDDCTKSEWDDCYFDERNGDFDFKIFLRPTTNSSQAHMDLIISDYRFSSSWHLNSHVLFSIPLDKMNLGDGQVYYDSLLINEVMQYDVFAAIPKLSSSPTTKNYQIDTIHPSLVYYNIHNGLIKVDFDDGSTWELKEILN